MTKKYFLKIFYMLLLAVILLVNSPGIKSFAMAPYGTTSSSTDDSEKPRGPVNPDVDDDDDEYDTVPEGSDDDEYDTVPEGSDDDEYDTVPEGSDDANTSSNTGSAGNVARGPANPDSADSGQSQSQNQSSSGSNDSGQSNSQNSGNDSGQSIDQNSSNDSTSINESNDNSNIVNIDNNIDSNNANTAVTTPAPKKEPGTFSLPFLEKKEGAPDPFEPGISLKERASRIWESMNDKEKKIVEVFGAIVGVDVFYHICKSLIKSVIKSKKKISNNSNNKKKKKGDKGDSDFERPEIEFEPKSVVTCLRDTTGNRDLVDYFNKKKFIEEKAIGFDKYDELEEKLNDEKADLIVLDLNTLEEFEEFKKLSSEKDSFALIVDDSIYKNIEAELNSIKEEKKITGFVPETAKKEAKLIKLVLPLFKPEINGENAAEVIGSVADALGIPYVSDILDAAMNGKEVIETIKEGDMDAVDKANVIGGIASILGFDSVQEITDIIDKVSMAKSVVNHETIDGESAKLE